VADTWLHALETRWHTEIPISATMGVRVQRFDGTTLTTAAALAPNLNVHGTAFAGSQFSLASLCGWGQVWLQLQAAGLEGSIVFVEGSIRCLAPVRDAMVARCAWNGTAAQTLDTLRGTGRARCQLDVRIESGDVVAAEFSGVYGIRAPGREARLERAAQ
jgi:thioesterase domain-containing protein